MKKINIIYFPWGINKYQLCEKLKHSAKDEDKVFNNLESLLNYLEKKYRSREIEISLDRDISNEDKAKIEKNIKEKFKKAKIIQYA
ncbi:MAG: hypothetical protein QXK80_00070 [Candidatus Pacearchaeota archaeon]